MSLSVSYLAVFSVQKLETLYVLQLNALWQRLALEVNVWELWESSGCIWNTGHMNCEHREKSDKPDFQ